MFVPRRQQFHLCISLKEWHVDAPTISGTSLCVGGLHSALTRLSYERSPREYNDFEDSKTRWCDNISYGGMPQHVREGAGGLTILRFVISMVDLKKLLEVITLALVWCCDNREEKTV